MSAIEDGELMNDFLAESYENLDQMERDLVALEANPTQNDILSGIFRAIHTLKGTAAFLGLIKIENIAHTGENLLSRLRDGRLKASPEIISALLALIDALRQMLKVLESTKAEGPLEFPELLARLEALQGTTTPSAPVASPATPIPAPAPPPTPDSAVAPLAAPKKEVPATAPESDNGSAADSSIRVHVGLLDKLMNLVGELVLARNQVLQYTSTQRSVELAGTSQRLNLITSELQEGIMKTRMQPISNIWSKFPRVVRDVARSCGRQVALEMEGQDTELDRTLIESIKDPLTHLVRNAIDHGVEAPEVRKAAGKSPEGRISLRAYHEGGQVIIEIGDDGAGLDLQKIRQKAMTNNLFSAEQLSKMTDREVIHLIYQPGFSTAETVTHVSGRGVGMDVVKTNIERIGGTIDVQSVLGKGTTFKIKIPLTLAIIPALVVMAGNERYAIPQVSLLELVRLTGDEVTQKIEYLSGCPVYRLRGNLLPLVDLSGQLQLGTLLHQAEKQAGVNIVVLQADDRAFGLVVDHVNDTEEIVVKPLGKQLKGMSAFAGATIMGDGRVALILDVLGIAFKAGVVALHHERGRLLHSATLGATRDGSRAWLLFAGPGDQRLAMPLSSVARLEEFPRTAIEQSGSNRMVQYRDQIMPLVSVGDLLGIETGGSEGETSLQVVVYHADGRTVGLVVERILDIVEVEVTVQKGTERPGVMGSAIIQHHITDLLDIDQLRRNVQGRWSAESAQGLRSAA